MNRSGVGVFRSAALWLFLVGYVAGMIQLHKAGNQTAARLMTFLGLEPYLWTMRVLAWVGIACICVWLARHFYRNPEKFKRLLLLIPIAVVLDLSLIVVPVERIHYVQYGFLTWLAYKALGKPALAGLVGFVSGVVDESYQYLVLYAGDPVIYFDWNDITLNLVGVLAVLMFVLPGEPPGKLPKKRILAAIVAWILAVSVLVLVFNPDQYLVRNDPYEGKNTFWITSGINTTYHVMSALQGLILLGMILIPTTAYYLPNRSRRVPPEPFRVERP